MRRRKDPMRDYMILIGLIATLVFVSLFAIAYWELLNTIGGAS